MPCAWRGRYVAELNVLNWNVEMRFWNGTTSRVYAGQAETPRLRDLRFAGMSGIDKQERRKAVQARPRHAAAAARRCRFVPGFDRPFDWAGAPGSRDLRGTPAHGILVRDRSTCGTGRVPTNWKSGGRCASLMSGAGCRLVRNPRRRIFRAPGPCGLSQGAMRRDAC